MHQEHESTRSSKPSSRAAAHNAPSGGIVLPAIPAFQFQSPIQRKVGFEFETTNHIIKEDEGNVPLKAHIWDNDNGRWHIQNDDSKLEFVTEPFEDAKDISTSISEMSGLITNMVEKKTEDNIYTTGGKDWKYPVKINIADKTFTASPQSTEGVLLEQIPELVKEHYPDEAWEQIHERAGKIIPPKSEENLDNGPVRGLLYAILAFLNDTLDKNLKISPMGPKQLLTLMHRTDFRSMYLSLSLQQRGLFRSWVKGGPADSDLKDNQGLMLVMKKKWKERIYAKPYHGAEANPVRKDEKWPGDKFSEFLASIWDNPNDTDKKDSQSPPAGYASHDEIELLNKTNAEKGSPLEPKYGMGTHGMVDGRALFEMRAYATAIPTQPQFQGLKHIDNDLPYTEWEAFANAVFAGAATRDKTLKTGEPPKEFPKELPNASPMEISKESKEEVVDEPPLKKKKGSME